MAIVGLEAGKDPGDLGEERGKVSLNRGWGQETWVWAPQLWEPGAVTTFSSQTSSCEQDERPGQKVFVVPAS